MSLRKQTTCQGIPVYRTTNDINGNPRYIVHWLDLDLPAYEATDATRKAGLRKYQGKAFGGGFVFTSYNLDASIKYILQTLKEEIK